MEPMLMENQMSEFPGFVLPATRGLSPNGTTREAGVGDGGTASSRLPSAEFEAAFLTEMLKHAGFGKAVGNQAGGSGESGFSDLLVRQVAERIARSRPLGIAAMLDEAVRRGGQ